MLKILILTTCFFTSRGEENKAPQIENVKFKVDKNKTVHLSYDLNDNENDSLSVRIEIYDGDNVLDLTKTIITGDLGFPVWPGRNKNLLISISSGVKITHIKIFVSDGYRPNIGKILDEVDSTRIRNALEEFAIVRNYETAPKNLSLVK